MPRLSFDLFKPHSQQLLVYIQNGGNHDRHREVLLHECVIQIKCLFYESAVVVLVIPQVEFSIVGQTVFLMLPFLDGEECIAVGVSDRSQFLFKIVEELVDSFEYTH